MENVSLRLLMLRRIDGKSVPMCTYLGSASGNWPFMRQLVLLPNWGVASFCVFKTTNAEQIFDQ